MTFTINRIITLSKDLINIVIFINCFIYSSSIWAKQGNKIINVLISKVSLTLNLSVLDINKIHEFQDV